MLVDTCVPTLIVIGTAINQLETKVYITKNSLLPEVICFCLQTVMLQHQWKQWVKDVYQV